MDQRGENTNLWRAVHFVRLLAAAALPQSSPASFHHFTVWFSLSTVTVIRIAYLLELGTTDFLPLGRLVNSNHQDH
ncbi:hypothetical protein Nepgr_005502 [Nepenthes gracilis]|uniref:Uncharacterized protein n=1 Tax=Nepenthes gracilis TaxID=150966 RepID=A0AAD3S394_NEPGR|nr:hypothetical protein Nepgr_005502 [Nepenthes gracilis]